MSNHSPENPTPKALYPDSLKEFLTAKAKERFPDKKIIILDVCEDKPVYHSETVKQVFFQNIHYQLNPMLTYQERIDPNLENCGVCECFVPSEGKCKKCNGFGQRPKGVSEASSGDMSGGLKAQKGTIGKIDLSEEVVSDDKNEEVMPELI